MGWVLGSVLPVSADFWRTSADFWRKRREKSRLSRKYTSCWGENHRKSKEEEQRFGVCQGSALPVSADSLRKRTEKAACQGSALPVGQNRSGMCRTNAGQGQRKGQNARSEERPKREGSRCNQAPGSTLVRKEIHGVTRAFALARIVPGKLPGSSAHLVCWRVPHRPGAPALGIAAPQSRETPAGADCWVHKRSCLPGGSESARCPALRSRRPFRFGDGVPARPCRARHGHFVRGGGRRAEPGLRTSRLEKPAAAAAKNRPRRGSPGIKRRLV